MGSFHSNFSNTTIIMKFLVLSACLAVSSSAPFYGLVAHPNGAVVPVDEPAVSAARADHLAAKGAVAHAAYGHAGVAYAGYGHAAVAHAGIVQAFKAYDLEGKIDSKMFTHALMTWGDKMTKAEIDDIFGEFEIDEDYMIKSKDVIGLFVAVKEEPKKEEEAPAPVEAPVEDEDEADAKKKKKKKKKAAK